TPFVRQNTPHPRELKAKAHKLFSKGQNSLDDSDLQNTTAHDSMTEAVNQVVAEQHHITNLPPVIIDQQEPDVVIENGAVEESSEQSADEDTDDDQAQKHVGFSDKTATADADPRPSRLHRRDTPHHLKNKRINTAPIDKDKVASIIAQVSMNYFVA
ncbi:hypothetical protein HHI36_016628, partial [Cryptolaemus montrouzieri]